MASSSGTSVDQRKRKRMQSNRESARRSRMKKQMHLDDLTAQISGISKENNQILKSIDASTQQYAKVEAENSILRAQMAELSQRLQSLDEILNYVNSSAAGSCLEEEEESAADGFFNSWNFMGAIHHPITASAEMFDYY